MAQQVEPMDIDSSICDFDNKENTSILTNVLPRTPCTEKGYEELDVTELNFKLRYSLTPNTSMSKSYTANRNPDSGDVVGNENNLTRSFNSNDTTKSLRPMPLQALPSEQFGDGNRSALRPLDSPTTLDNVTSTITSNDIDENLSLPSSSSSMAHTPEATTPTNEIPKSDGSPIMRGLKSVLNMFRPSQSPIPPDGFSPIPAEEEKEIVPETLSPPVIHSPDTSNSRPQMVLASTPLAAYRTKDVLSRHKTPNTESLVFNEDLEKDLQWNDETTIIFSHEKIPLHKLLFPTKPSDSVQKKNNITREIPKEEEQLDSTVEYMDISYNNSIVKDKTVTEDDVINKENIATESDSEFVDCESTFTKNESLADPLNVSNQMQENNNLEGKDELNETITKEIDNETALLEIKAEEFIRLPADNSLNQVEVINKNNPVIENQVLAEVTETNNTTAHATLEDINNGNVLEFKPDPQIIDSTLNNTNFVDSKVNTVNPVNTSIVDNVVVSSLYQIPLISDPRVLLFNISQTVNDDNNDVLNANTTPADIPLPDDDDENQTKLEDTSLITDAKFVNATENNNILLDSLTTTNKILHPEETINIVDKTDILVVTSAKETEMNTTFEPITFDISKFINEELATNLDTPVTSDVLIPEAKVTFEADKLNENNQSYHNDTFAIVDEISALESELENKSDMSKTINKSSLGKSLSICEQKLDTCGEENTINIVKSDEVEPLKVNITAESLENPKVECFTNIEPQSPDEISIHVQKDDAKIEMILQQPVLKTGNDNVINEVQTLQADTELNAKNEVLVTPELEVYNNQVINAEDMPTVVINNEEYISSEQSIIADETVTNQIDDEVKELKMNAENTPNFSEDINIEIKSEPIAEEMQQDTNTLINELDIKNNLPKEVATDGKIQDLTNGIGKTIQDGNSTDDNSADKPVNKDTTFSVTSGENVKESSTDITCNFENIATRESPAVTLSKNEPPVSSVAEEDKKDHTDTIKASEPSNTEETSQTIVKDDVIVASEGNSPFVSVSADINEFPEKQPSDSNEEIENQFDTQSEIASTPPASPPIASKGYNFNFDEIEDPFATRVNIRLSPPPVGSPNKTFEAAPKSTQQTNAQKKDFNQYRRRSQPERKKPVTNNKKMNSTFSGCNIKPSKSETNETNNKNDRVTFSSDKTFEEAAYKPNSENVCVKDVNSMIATENESVNDMKKLVANISDEGKMSIDPVIFCAEKRINTVMDVEQMPVDEELHTEKLLDAVSIEEKMSIQSAIESIKEKVTPSSSEQSTYFSAGTSSNESITTPKSVFNLPEIEDTNFNRFATITKTKHSPISSSQDNAALNTSSPKEIQNTTFGINATIHIESKESYLSGLNEANEKVEHVDSLNNISGSTNCTDEKNNTAQEVHTEDEDTVEGPFIEANLKDDRMIDFGSADGDMMNFVDLPAQANDNNADAGELFIDADAFEFLLNQNQANTVADSGKESLFLKFDPLFAKRMSSSGVVAALSKVQTRQSTPKKTISQDETIVHKSPIAGPSTMNVTQDIDANVTEESIDELNITVSKPMMVVNPAVNAIVTPRNKTMSPVSSNRRSLTFTSPAIAVIDRLLSMSANNSLVHDTTIAEVNREQNEAELALMQLRELLADKEISVYNLRTESKELKDRLVTLETQMNTLETISEERLKNINELTEKLNEKTQLNKRMASVVEEYERTIASLIAETEEDKKRHAEERIQLIQERDEQTVHLASMEVSFSDLHSKYEKSKQLILGFKTNEDTYKKSIKEFKESLAKMQANYESLKQHATSKLNHANEELQKMNRAHESEMLKLNAMIKRKELHITSLEETLLQKTKTNEELTKICDDLINKVGLPWDCTKSVI